VFCHVKFGSSASKAVCVKRREPSKLGALGHCPLWVGARLTAKNKSSPNMCHYLKFGSSATKGVCINRKKPTKFGIAGTQPHDWPPRKVPSQNVLPPQIWYFCVKEYMHKYKGTPKIGERWGPAPLRYWRGWPPKNMILPTCVILPNLVALGQRVQALLRRSAWKFDPLRPAFQGHSLISY